MKMYTSALPNWIADNIFLYFPEHPPHTSIHDVATAQRDGGGARVRVRPVDHGALQPLGAAGRLPHYEHRLSICAEQIAFFVVVLRKASKMTHETNK